MEILHDCDVIPCLKKSDFYKAFLKTSDDGKILLHVPPEYIITNDELQIFVIDQKFVIHHL